MLRGTGGGLSHTSLVPCFWINARALPGFDSRCRTREVCAYITWSLATVSKDGSLTTVFCRADFFESTWGDADDKLASGLLSPLFVIWYGSTGGAIAPGRSISVESCSVHLGSMFFETNTVPRISRMSSMASPEAIRCVSSTRARSAFPYNRMSAFASSKMDRRTFSDQ